MSRGIPRKTVKNEQTADSATALNKTEEKTVQVEAKAKAPSNGLENPNGTAKSIENEAPVKSFDVEKALKKDLMLEKMRGG